MNGNGDEFLTTPERQNDALFDNRNAQIIIHSGALKRREEVIKRLSSYKRANIYFAITINQAQQYGNGKVDICNRVVYIHYFSNGMKQIINYSLYRNTHFSQH